MLIADECLAQITENHQYYKKSEFLWKAHEMLPYQRDISESRCLKHSHCQNVLFTLELYENSSSVIENVYQNGYDCLKKEYVKITLKMDDCSKKVRMNTYSDMLNNCTRPIINELDCDKDEIEALNEAINKSLGISEHFSFREGRNSGAHVGLVTCMITILGFITVFP